MKEMSSGQMESVSGGDGASWSLKDLWLKIISLFAGEDEKNDKE